MKRVIAITAGLLLAVAAIASAQSATEKPLADVAKQEEARRKSIRKPAKVYTNGSLRADPNLPVVSSSEPGAAGAGAAGAPAGAAPGAAAPPPDAPAEDTGGGDQKDQAYWQNRMKAARDALARNQLFADSLQTRINSLWTDFVNRDDPAQKAKLEADRNTALAELEKVKKEIEAQTKAIAGIEDEARKAGVPPGWLRQGA
jgi:hypothetical protein